MGNILDFRQQEEAVNAAIALFSGENTAHAKEVWLVDPAPVVIDKLAEAMQGLEASWLSKGFPPDPRRLRI